MEVEHNLISRLVSCIYLITPNNFINSVATAIEIWFEGRDTRNQNDAPFYNLSPLKNTEMAGRQTFGVQDRKNNCKILFDGS